MKFNWGHAITIVFILFAGYILSFVYRSMNHDVQLVSEDYYARELAFQGQIDAGNNAAHLNEEIQIIVGENGGIQVQFPLHYTDEIKSGVLAFFRPSDQALDRTFALTLDADKAMYIPTHELSKGRYVVNITWESKGASFYVQKNIVI